MLCFVHAVGDLTARRWWSGYLEVVNKTQMRVFEALADGSTALEESGTAHIGECIFELMAI